MTDTFRAHVAQPVLRNTPMRLPDQRFVSGYALEATHLLHAGAHSEADCAAACGLHLGAPNWVVASEVGGPAAASTRTSPCFTGDLRMEDTLIA